MARGIAHPPSRRIPPVRLVPGDAFVACLVAQEGQEEIVSGPRFRIE